MVKIQKYLLQLLIVLLFFITSCYSKLIQKAYLTNPPNICLFDSAQATSLKFTGNLRYIENQASYSFSDNWGVATNLFLGYRLQYGGDLGLVFYEKFNNKHYFEISNGYGYFKSYSIIKNRIGSMYGMAGGNFYGHHIDCIYHKVFSQPSYFFSKKNIDYGLTLRFSLPYFTNYDCTYDLSPYAGSYWLKPVEYSKVQFKNKWGYTIEPVLTLRVKEKKSNKFFQFGMCFSDKMMSTSIKNNQGYDDWRGPFIEYTSLQTFPLHANFFFNVGIEFNKGKLKVLSGI